MSNPMHDYRDRNTPIARRMSHEWYQYVAAGRMCHALRVGPGRYRIYIGSDFPEESPND